jgi:putative tricarboxylic transport membrane protein
VIPPRRRGKPREGVLAGVAVLGLAALLAWQTLLIPAGAGQAAAGPRAAPWFVTALLAGLGLAILVEHRRRAGAAPAAAAERPARLDRAGLGWVSAGLALNAALIGPAGFIVATSVLFACTARGFGSSRPLRDAAIGFFVATGAHLVFARLLDYPIGGGLVEQFL